jgi:DNA-binding LytR/AlgR family response regulator
MKVIIIEDEPLASAQISEFVHLYSPDILVLTILTSIKEMAQWLEENSIPDLILSDIELLDGNIFSIFDLMHIPCPIIFITAYDHFLLQAFEKNGIAYLLKPVKYEKFVAAMQKYEQLKRNFSLLNNDLFSTIKNNALPTQI